MKRPLVKKKIAIFFLICFSLFVFCSCSSNDDDSSDLKPPQNESDNTDNQASNDVDLPRPKAKWTFISYMAADESVDSFGLYEIMKLQSVGSSDNVHVVAQYDRSEYETYYWNKAYGNWTDARRFYIQKKTGISSSDDFLVDQQDTINYMKKKLSPETMGNYEYAKWVANLEGGNQADLDTFTLEQLISNLGRSLPDGFNSTGLQQKSIQSVGEINTGDPANLIDFVVWAINNFPAEHYVLSLFGHGTGWLGYGYDYSAGSIDYSNFDMIDLPELDQAMTDIFQQTNISKFDLFVWHACLMGQLEVISATAPFADYALASVEALDRSGWDYTAMITKINDDPDVTPLELGKTLANATYAYMSQPEHYVADTSVYMYDLSKLQSAVDAVNNFARNVSLDKMDDLRNIALSRYDTPTMNHMDRGTSSIDLINFMQRVASRSTEPAKTLANTVIHTVNNAIIDNCGGTNAAEIYYGMGIYYPIDKNAYDIFYPGVGTFSTEYPAQVSHLDWSQFLTRYYQQIDSQLENTTPQIEMVLDNSCSDRPYSFQNPPPVILTTSGKGLANVQFSVFSQKDAHSYIEHVTNPIRYKAYKTDKTLIDIMIPETEMENDFLWNAWVPSLKDDEKYVQVAFVTEASRPDETKVYGYYYPKGSTTGEAVFLLVEDKEGGKVLSMWQKRGTKGAASSSYEMPTNPGDQFEPTFRQPGHGSSPVSLGERLTFSDKPFTVKYKAADKGSYKLQMKLQNLAGTISTAELSIDIDNTDPALDTSYLGYNGLEIGASFLYPVDWERLNVSDETLGDDILRIFVNADHTADIHVYSYSPGQSLSDETDSLVDKLNKDLTVSLISAVQPIDTQGNDNYLSEYTMNKLSWKQDEKLHTTYIIHEPVTGQSNRFTLISSEADTESKAVLEKMMATLRFFERVKFN